MVAARAAAKVVVATAAVKAAVVVKKDKKDTIAPSPSRPNAGPQSPSKADRTTKPATMNRTSTAWTANLLRRAKEDPAAHAKVASAADAGREVRDAVRAAAQAAVDAVLGAAEAAVDAAARAEALAAADVAPAAEIAVGGKHKVPRLAAIPAARSG
jgi:hypothetical protein